MERASCLICGAPLQPAGRGRVYCTVPCRRAAEFELRRLQRQLDDLERYARNLRMMGASQRQQARVQGEIDRAVERLRTLMAGLPEPAAPPSPGGHG